MTMPPAAAVPGRQAALRILIVHNRYRSEQPSGENQVVDQEAALLSAGGHDVLLYQRDSDDISRFDLLEKIELPIRVTWSVRDAREMTRVLRDFQPDVVHVHNVFPLISASVLSACTDAGVPVVATLHNFRLVCAAGTLLRDEIPCELCVGHSPLPGIRYGCYRGSRSATVPVAFSIGFHRNRQTWAGRVSTFLVMSHFAKGLMARAGLPEERIVVKPNFIPSPHRLRVGAGEHIMYLGRLSREKGVDLLIDAWQPQFGKLLVVGDGDQRQTLVAQAAHLGGRVEFLGVRPHADAMGLIAKSSAVVMPSRWYETFGMSAVEAMAHGVAAIVPDQGVLPEIVAHGVSGLHFRSGDSDSLRSAISTLLHADTADRLGVAARRQYLEMYSPESNLSTLEQIYRTAMAGIS